MRIQFWGVRGSIPAPGPDTAETGGNTACVELITESGVSIVMDAGTGIRPFGIDYLGRNGAPRIMHLLISHVHWDHIQGLPFFPPIYFPDFEIHIYGVSNLSKMLNQQMKHPFFPIEFPELNSKITFHTIESSPLEIAGCTVSPLSLKHPQEVLGYRIEDNGKSVVYSSDTEYTYGEDTSAFIEAIRDSELLMYDAQYTPEEYESGKIGWGHSTYEAAAKIARKANIKTLILFHHEPTHNDRVIREIEEKARKLFPNTIAAREGVALDV